MNGKRQKPARLSKRQHRQYLKAIDLLAQKLPPMEGYDHKLNMVTLFQQQGPEAVQGYIGAVDSIIAKAEAVIKRRQEREN